MSDSLHPLQDDGASQQSAERLPQDHAARLAALDPSGSFLVQAPAGSGKTELLTDRILALLPTVTRPEEIVAITFTRKAASEMHARVLHKLQQAHSGVEPEGGNARRSWLLARAALAHDAEQGWRLLDHPARLSIRTIDSFCAGLIRAMPWLSALGGMPAIVDDAREHFAAAADATLALADDFDAVRTLLAHLDVDVAAARDAIAGMLGQRDQWLPLLAHAEDRDAVEAALAEAVAEDIARVHDAMPIGWAQSLSGPARMAAAALDALGDPAYKLAALRDWEHDLPADAAALPMWTAVADLLLTAQGGLRSPKGVNKNLGFPAGSAHKTPFTQWLEGAASDPHASRWVPLLAGVRHVPPPFLSDAQWEVLSAQMMALRIAVAQLRMRFAETGEVDFIEIAQRAAMALGSADEPGELLLKLDATIRHLLIDEFQDTSQTQIDLLATLTSGWQENDGRTLFLVGDPMQSIYRFRKAEVGLFLKVRDHGLGLLAPKFLQLTDNFRSQAGIVEWVNRNFHGIMPARDDAPSGAIAYAKSTPFHAPLEGDAVSFAAAWSGEDAVLTERQAQAHVIDVIDRTRAQYGSDHRIAILVRARGHLGGLARALTARGIRSRAVDLVQLNARPAVADLIQLMRAQSHPGDRMAWLSVLRAPWCGLTLNSFEALFGEDHHTPIPALIAAALKDDGGGSLAQRVLAAPEFARLQRVAHILLDDDNASGALPMAAALQRTWQRLGGAALYGGTAAEHDVESLLMLIERLAPHGGLDAERLDAAVQRLYANPDPAEADVVDIMTMHKSKGLQFDTVVLYGLHRAPRSDQSPLVRIEQSGGRVLFGPIKARADQEADPISRYLAMREKQRAEYETDRLLYVAATRAKQRLHLIAHVSLDNASGAPKAPAASSLLARLWPSLQCEAPPTNGDAPQAGEVVDVVAPPGQPLSRIDDAAVAWLTTQDDTRNRWREQRAPLRYAGGDRSAWRTESTFDAAIGTLAHAWLARIGQDGMDRWPATTLAGYGHQLERQLTRAGVPAAHAEESAQAVMETLLATLSHERGRWLLSQAGARREWPLIDAAGKVSVIDLALSTEAGWLIVDYKTGRQHPGESEAAFAERMRARHGDQLARYCAQVTALDGRPARAALYFPRAGAWIDV